jgi:hypothetical protein
MSRLDDIKNQMKEMPFTDDLIALEYPAAVEETKPTKTIKKGSKEPMPAKQTIIKDAQIRRTFVLSVSCSKKLDELYQTEWQRTGEKPEYSEILRRCIEDYFQNYITDNIVT